MHGRLRTVTTSIQIPLFQQAPPSPSAERAGVVYTRRWIVEFMLDLAGYVASENLVDRRAVEPAAGEGAFLVPMAERLIDACRRMERPLTDCASSLLAFELDGASAAKARDSLVRALEARAVPRIQALSLARGWVRVGDYLAEAPRLAAVHLVIGNPPYIRLEDLDDAALAFYRETYGTMRGRADIYVGFFEAALRQLAPSGACAFICADRWMSNQYGAALRGFVTETFAVETVVELHDADPFEQEVSAYPAVTLLRRGAQGDVAVARMEKGAQAHPPAKVAALLTATRDKVRADSLVGITAARVEGWASGEDPWPCTSPARIALLKRLESEFGPLEDEATGTRVSIGVASGCDKVFITKDRDLVERSRLLPLAMVADTRDGAVSWSGHYLVNPWEESGLVDLERYPRLRDYFARNATSLRRRHIVQRRPDAWFRTIDRVHIDLTKRPKLYFPDIRDAIHPVLDRGETYPHHNLYFLVSTEWDLEVLGGLLLSAVGQFFVEVYGVRMRGGWLRFQAQYLRRIRVPQPDAISAAHADTLRAAFRARDAYAATTIACEIYRIPRDFFGDKG